MPAVLRSWSPPLAAALLVGCQPELGPRDPVEYAVDLAEDIPMTGVVDPVFAEVDIAMRQFVKWRCAGAGVLAISYKGRRVYKRGFGRMNGRASEALYPGCGDDATNPFDPDAALVPPDAPMYLGSVSKPIAAAIARWLIDERLDAHPELAPPPCEGRLCSCDEPPCPRSGVDLKIADPAADLLPPRLAATFRGEIPVPLPLVDEPCTYGHDVRYADPRWREITVGNLISHQAGLRRSGYGWASVEADKPGAVAAMRGYADGDEAPWIAEDASIRAAHAASLPAIDAAAAFVSGRNGGAPVYFVNRFNLLGGEQPLDDGLRLNLGLCLEYTPGVAGEYGDGDGLYEPVGQQGRYSNFGLTVVGRIIEHLQMARTGGVYYPYFDQPQTARNSALAEFLAVELGIDAGIETPEGIVTLASSRTFPGAPPPPNPIPRVWNGKSYYPDGYESKVPYCVWHDGRCDFAEWLRARDGSVGLRPDLAWTLTDDGRGFARVPAWAEGIDYSNSAGGLVSEAPIYLAFASKFNISGRSDLPDNGNGTPRVNPITRTGGHTGSLAGGYAVVLQSAAKTMLRGVPPVVDGHLVDDFDHLQSRMMDRQDLVDYVAAVNQNSDSRCTSRYDEGCSTEYGQLSAFIDFALDRVDWAAVDQLLEDQRHQVVGMAITAAGSHFWFADDHHIGSQDPIDVLADVGAADHPGTPYRLPSTRIGPDVLGISMDPQGRVVAWYDDGRYSVGDPLDLASLQPPARFSLAEGHEPTDVLAVAIGSDGVTRAWYTDGTWSAGTPDALAVSGGGSFTVEAGYDLGDIEAIAFEGHPNAALPDIVWTRFRDGSTVAGTVAALGRGL